MSAESKKSMSWAIVLMLLGALVLYGGPRWLAVLVPAALLIRYGIAGPMLRSRRS